MMKTKSKPGYFLLGITLILSGLFSQAFSQVSTAEKDALMALYNATAGSSWTHHDNWGTTAPVSSWYGVTVSGDKVVQLNLKDNNLVGYLPVQFFDLTNLTFLHLKNNSLSGSVPDEIGNLVNLTFLGLNNNQFSGNLPNTFGNLTQLSECYLQQNEFTGDFPSTGINLVGLKYGFFFENEFESLPTFAASTLLLELRVHSNKLEFDDLELNLGTASVFTYSPQAVSGTASTTTTTQGSSVTLSAGVGGTNNTYQWYKNGVLMAGKTAADLLITNAQSTDAGIYTCQVQNTMVTGLTISTAPQTLAVLPFVLITGEAENVTATAADIPYEVNFGVATMTDHGIVWGTNPLPTTADHKNSSGSTVNGSFTINLTTLSQNNTYYARSYAVESGTTYYGNEISFTTPDLVRGLLTALYNQTDGDNWTDNTNWLTDADISTWYGIAVLNGDIVRIDLSNNNLTGLVPDLSPLTQLTRVDISGNNLQFGDLELNGPLMFTLGTNFIYDPQNQIVGSGGTYNIAYGEFLDLQVTCSGTGNTYQWYYYDLSSGWLYLPGMTTNTFTFSHTDDYKYRCVVSNPNFTHDLLTFDYVVNVRTDRDILMEFYDHNGGVNWNVDYSWNTTDDLAYWVGIEVDGNDRVIGIALPYNNLTGSLYVGLSELSELKYIELGNNSVMLGSIPNQMTGQIPKEWAVLTNLTFLDLAGNNLEGNIPAEFISLTKLGMINLNDCGLSGDVPEVLGNLASISALIIEGNNITGLPNLAPKLISNYGIVTVYLPFSGPTTAPSTLGVGRNNLEFDDLQKQVPTIFDGGYTAQGYYIPQAKINQAETITVLTGREVQLSCQTAGLGLTYKWWYCDTEGGSYTDLTGVSDPNISGADQATLTIANMASGYQGYYYCTVNNITLPFLTLQRETIHLLEGTFDLNASVPYWYITTATTGGAMHNKIMIPALADESGLTNLLVYGYEQVSYDYTELLATIPFTGSSTGYEFIDLGSDPGVRAFGYKISVVDDLGNESDKSDYQQSVHLATNLGLNNVRNLSWTHYEPGNMVSSYDVLGGNSLDISTMTSITNLPKFLNSYTDNGSWNYYVIQTNFAAPPVPFKTEMNFNSVSNILSIKGAPQSPDLGSILIYPNPANEITMLQFENPNADSYSLIVNSINGATMLRRENITSNTVEIGIRELPKGLYIVQLIGNQVFLGKLVIK